MTLYYRITLVTLYIMTSRNTVVYHFREHALDEFSQQLGSYKVVKRKKRNNKKKKPHTLKKKNHINVS